MGYVVFFVLVLGGYTLLDWGHYVLKHERVTMWYLVSKIGDPPVLVPGGDVTQRTLADGPLTDPSTGRSVSGSTDSSHSFTGGKAGWPFK